MIDIHNFKKRVEYVEECIKNSSISEENKKIIFSYERQMFIKGFKMGTIEKHLYALKTIISERVVKRFNSMEKADIETFLEWIQRRNVSDWTKYNYKHIFRALLRYLSRDDLANLIKIKSVTSKIPDILTRDEVLKMIDSAVHPMDKALIAGMYETGCRVQEIASLQIKDIHFDSYGAIFIVDGKTGPRRVRAIFSSPYLSAWLELHPKKLDRNAPVWINLKTAGEGNDYKLLLYPALRMRIKRIAKKAGIQKRVYNHLFRHTSATEKAEFLTDSLMDEYFGWVQGSNMTRVYVHRSGKNLDNVLFNAFGIVKDKAPHDKELTPIQCSRCSTINGTTAKFCYKCGAALDLLAAIDVDKERTKERMEIMDAIRNKPEILDIIQNLLEERKKSA